MLRVLAVIVCVLWAGSAEAAKRVALVMGVGAYAHTAPLKNPANDADAIAKALTRLGFEVTLGKDLNFADMRKTVRSFARSAQGASVALFFYAGHGVQVAGKNYLIPTDAKLSEEVDLDFSAVDVDLVLRQINRAASTKIIILDACRDNPFRSELSRSMGATRSAALGRGLARIEAAGGSMISFATDPGDVALDGAGDHSPFTESLLKHVETPGLEINLLMQRVRTDVYKGTGKRQRPWTSTSLIGEVYLAGKAAPTPQAAPATPAPQAAAPQAAPTPTAPASPPRAQDSALEIAVWNAAEAGGGVADFEAYLNRYPDGAFAGLARSRIAKLKTEQLAARPDPAPTPAQPPAPAATVPQPSPAAGSARTERALGLSRENRREIQTRLALAGYDPGGADGAFGRRTRSAIQDWQSDAGYAATGYLNADQIDALLADTEDDYADYLAEERRRRDAANAQRQRQTPIFRAQSYCSMTGVTGFGQGNSAEQALYGAVENCVARGGIPDCCINGARLTN